MATTNQNAGRKLNAAKTARINQIVDCNLRLMECGLAPAVSFHFVQYGSTFQFDISDPMADQEQEHTVDPIAYYGDAFLESDFFANTEAALARARANCKRERI